MSPSLRRAPAGRARSRTSPGARAALTPGPGFPRRLGLPCAPRSRRRSSGRAGGSLGRRVSAHPPPGKGGSRPRSCSRAVRGSGRGLTLGSAPPGQICSPQLDAQEAAWRGDQLSSQLYRNKQVKAPHPQRPRFLPARFLNFLSCIVPSRLVYGTSLSYWHRFGKWWNTTLVRWGFVPCLKYLPPLCCPMKLEQLLWVSLFIHSLLRHIAPAALVLEKSRGMTRESFRLW